MHQNFWNFNSVFRFVLSSFLFLFASHKCGCVCSAKTKCFVFMFFRSVFTYSCYEIYPCTFLYIFYTFALVCGEVNILLGFFILLFLYHVVHLVCIWIFVEFASHSTLCLLVCMGCDGGGSGSGNGGCCIWKIFWYFTHHILYMNGVHTTHTVHSNAYNNSATYLSSTLRMSHWNWNFLMRKLIQ